MWPWCTFLVEFSSGIPKVTQSIIVDVALRKSIPYVIKTLPEPRQVENGLNRRLLKVYVVYTLLAFTFVQLLQTIILLMLLHSVSWKQNFLPIIQMNICLYFIHQKKSKVYLFYDSVHLLKNIRNNLLNAKRFLFPSFLFQGLSEDIKFNGGEIS